MPLGPELGCGVSGLRDVYLEVGGVAMGEAGEVDGKPDPRAACVQRERDLYSSPRKPSEKQQLR